MTPQETPALTAEVVGDLLIGVEGTLLGLGVLNWVVSVPEFV
ncbi:hypothetical protein ACFQJ7_09580 [Halovenus rubra]|uniref:Uncharacterized protein n=2 Tax=Halovenus rubra TaxID=869890 RepID=A0ABD5X508_9EURY|nr:hypothetical protein [Halovenus rubra]